MKILLDNKLNKHDKLGCLGEDISQETDSLGNPLTQEQSNFFNNSKIRNFNTKQLLVCYHATNADFDTFDKSFIGSGSGGVFGKGFYFTTHSDTAKDYGSKLGSYYLNITNPYDYYDTSRDNLLNLLNKSGYKYDQEFVDNFDYENWDADLLDDFLSYALVDDNAYDVVSDMVEKAGYDGIWAGSEIIAFEPNQIKLVSNKQPTNSNKFNESLHSLGSACFITDSPYDIKNLLLNKPKLYRILYDANIDMYMIGDGSEVIHWDMIREAYKQGYYANQEEFIDGLGGALDNYVETGNYGLYDDDYEVDPYLLYMVYSPDEDDFMLGEDGYDGVSRFGFGSLFFRDADQGLMDNCDLIRLLQKHSWANESMELNEASQEVDSLGNPLTQEQVRFFADSKVRDRQGNLLVCYHGTDSKFTTFEKGDIGFHFGTESAATTRREYKDNPENWYVDKYYLNIKNYIDTYDFGDWDGMTVAHHLVESRLIDLSDEEIKMLQILGTTGGYYDDTTTKQVRDFLTSKGIDGFMYENAYEDEGSMSYIVFNSNQIKSITNKAPTNSNNINEEVDENGNEMKENMSNNELKESMDITNEVQRAVDSVMKNKSKYRTQDDLESAIYSVIANCFSGMHGVTRDTADMIADVYEKELKRVELNTMNEEFVNELVPGELYHFIHNNNILYGTFKKKTPAWLFFDVEGKEVLAKPWTSVATTTEELEELIGLVDKMEKDTKVPSQVPNRFTRVPNQHNKPIGESNELADRANKHKKKSKGMGWHMAVNAGDVEKGIEVFNNSTSLGSGEGAPMGESVEQNVYHYNGPIYYRGHKIAEYSNITTMAKSISVAIKNVLVKAARGDSELYNYDIVDGMVRQVEDDYDLKPERPRCHTCGYELNDIGDCPVCDYGEDDLLESLTDLEALWELSNLD